MPFTVDFSGKQKWWVHFPGNETLNFLWHFPVSIDKFLRCSHLLERHPWLPAKEAKSCLYDLNGLQLPSLPGIWKKTHPPAGSAPEPLAELLESFLSPKQGWQPSTENFHAEEAGFAACQLCHFSQWHSQGFLLLAFSFNSIFPTLPEVLSVPHYISWSVILPRVEQANLWCFRRLHMVLTDMPCDKRSVDVALEVMV